MESIRRSWFRQVVYVVVLVWSGTAALAQPWRNFEFKGGAKIPLTQVAAEKLPKQGAFWSLQRQNYPPLPFNAFPDLPVYDLGNGTAFLVDDTSVDYAAIAQEHAEQQALRLLEREFGLLSESEFSLLEGGGGGMETYSYSSSDLWIELVKVENDYAYLTLHGTIPDDSYQLLSKTNLAQQGEWKLGDIVAGAAATNQTDFNVLTITGDPNQFFRAHHANDTIWLSAEAEAVEPSAIFSGQDGQVRVHCASTNIVTVYYRLSGTATNGGDYTNLTGQITIPANAGFADISFHPLADSVLEGTETIIVTVVQTNSYLIQVGAEQRNITIKDSPITVGVYVNSNEAIEANGPPGAAKRDGQFYISRTDDTGLLPPMQVRYSMSGTASNGVDYTTLSGVVNFAQDDADFKYVDIIPMDDNLVEGAETVVLTLSPTNLYNLEPTATSALVTINDTTTTVVVTPDGDAVEPHPASSVSKQTGQFLVNRPDTRSDYPALTVSYQLTGTAASGIDYTNMTGTVTFQSNQISATVFIEPLFDGQLEGDEMVTLTLTHVGDGYNISPDTNFASAAIIIHDNNSTNLFQRVAYVTFPIGIDYHQPSNSVIVSGSANGGSFTRLYTNTVSTNLVTAKTNWSGIQGLVEEVKLFTVKATAHGFTNGDMYFGSGNNIGWLSADGTRSNLTWCVLTNAVETNAPIRGGLYQDETGRFGYDLIAVTSPGAGSSTPKGVWRITAQGLPTLLTNINTGHLEGVTVLTNDVAKWGTWAGKILSGDELSSPPLIYAINTDGVVETFDTTSLIAGGIRTEDFDIIPPNQDLYVCDPYGGQIMKMSRDYFTNFVGDLLITDAGELYPPGKLFILHWNAATAKFNLIRIPYSAVLEHVTFAPINLPPLNP